MRISTFDRVLSVSAQDLEIEFRACCSVPWADFILNPRLIRGSDFLMRWSQGVWSENCLIQAVHQTARFIALPYGPSGTAPNDDPREVKLYFERLDGASTNGLKRPDLLLLRKRDEALAQAIIEQIGGIAELPFTHEDDPRMQRLLAMALIAIECENSLWVAKKMPDYGSILTPQRRLGGKLGFKKTAVLPTIIIKNEDRERLLDWERGRRIPIHVWHAFYDLAFGIPLATAESLIRDGLILPTEQVFQAPGGATTKKEIYKIYYQYAYSLGESKEEPNLKADHVTDKNGHILPYVRFEGGSFALSAEALKVLDGLAAQ
jgi:hypothetical protein